VESRSTTFPEGVVSTFDVTFAVPQHKNCYDDALGRRTYSAHLVDTTFEDR